MLIPKTQILAALIHKVRYLWYGMVSEAGLQVKGTKLNTLHEKYGAANNDCRNKTAICDPSCLTHNPNAQYMTII